MAQILVNATKDGRRTIVYEDPHPMGLRDYSEPCWVLHYVVRIPAGTEGAGPNGRYNVTVIEVPGPEWYH